LSDLFQDNFQQRGRGMSMMEEGDKALSFEREIYWLSEQAEMWLDSVDRTIRCLEFASYLTF
jgi:hypothetical protein